MRRAEAHGVCAIGLACCALLLTGAAAPPEAESLDALTRAGLHLRPSKGWTAELVEELRRGLEALPPEALPPVGGPIELVWHDEPSAFGMGDGSAERPEWSGSDGRDGRDESFHLYAYLEPDEPRALARLSALDIADRERLWRRRAVVHAVLSRWEHARHWSDAPAWRRIQGWSQPWLRPWSAERPYVDYSWAFSRERGRTSARLDWLTFAEEALWPAEALSEAALPVDERVRCQEFTRLRRLREQLAPLGQAPWLEPIHCPAFEDWVRFDSLDHIEVVYAEPSTVHPESVFGHLLLRPMYRDVHDRRPRIIEGAAVTGFEEPVVGRMWNGLVGNMKAIWTAGMFEAVFRNDVIREGRGLRRYRLNLTRDEQRSLLERAWELERRGYLPYRFLSDNCATLLVFLLNGALDDARQIPHPAEPWIIPTPTLDAIASVDDEPGRTPLLTVLPDPIVPPDVQLERDQRRRDQLIRSLRSRLSSANAAALDDWAAQVGSLDVEARARGYSELPKLVSTWRPSANAGAITHANADAVRDTDELLRILLRIERTVADQAQVEELKLEEESIIREGLPLPTADELILERQQLYRHERTGLADLADLDHFVKLAGFWAHAPRRPLTSDERVRLDASHAEEALFLRLADLCADLLVSTDSEAVAGSGGGSGEVADAVDVVDERPALRSSGYLHWWAGLGWARDDAGSGAALWLRTSFWAERWGEARERGFGSETELHLLDGETLLQRSGEQPTISEATLELVGFRTLHETPDLLRRHFWEAIGRGFGLEFDYRRSDPVPYSASLHGELYSTLERSEAATRYLALGLGLGVEGRVKAAEGPLGVGPRVVLSGRWPLPGSPSNDVRLEASYQPRWTPFGPRASDFEHEAQAALELEWLLGDRSRPVLLRPEVRSRYQRVLDRDDWSERAGVTIEW
jgi:hypothetical protein